MKAIAVASGKGGTGKSVIAAGLAVALANQGFKVIIIELGASPRTIDIILGEENNMLYNTADAINGKCDFEDAKNKSMNTKNLYIISCSENYTENRDIDEENIQKLILNCKDFDYVIIDGIDPVTLPTKCIDMNILVTTPDVYSIRSTSRLAKYIRNKGAQNLRLVINKIGAEPIPIKGIDDYDDIIDIIQARVIGTIPESPKLHYSFSNGISLDKRSITPQIIDNIAQRITGKDIALLIK